MGLETVINSEQDARARIKEKELTKGESFCWRRSHVLPRKNSGGSS